jgi:hypothetical protein
VRYSDRRTDDWRRAAIHANLKRRGLTALQFAHLCANLRKEHNWTGTAEVAKYLGVSRAQVSQHDKLLQRPEGMSRKAYNDLLALVQAGRAGSDTAFYTLTHVEPAKAGEVLERAQALAEADGAKNRVGKGGRVSPARPARQESQQEALKTGTEPSKEASEPARAPAPKAKVEKKHVRQAAEESRAIKQQTQRTIPELRALFDKLRGPGYPDPMRNFISVIAEAWWRGDASDREVTAHWTQIAMLVESAQKAERRLHGTGVHTPRRHIKKALKRK